MAKFKPGESGNKNGRPRGTSNKVPTTKQLHEMLSRREKAMIDVIVEIALNNENPNARLKAALAHMGFSIQIRDMVMKEAKHKVEMKQKELEVKQKQKELSEEDESGSVSATTPVISLTAVKQ